MWKPIVKDKKDIAAIEDKISEITSALLHNLSHKSHNLLDGKAGFFLYFAYMNKYGKTAKYNAVMEELIGECFGAINTGELDRSSFCTGISGLLWAVHHLNSEEVIDVDDHFEDLTAMLINHADGFGKKNDFDFLHGASGIVFYLSHIQQYLPDNNYINTFVKDLRKEGIEDETTIKWITPMYIENNKPVYNLSLSHGISSLIIILCTLQQYAPENEEIEILIKKSVNFLTAQKKEITTDANKSLFPGYISDHGSNMESRLSWCYGDIGNALALLNAGQLLNDERLIDEAVQIMLYNANRRDLGKNGILDAGICHGAAGLTHIFNRFYQQTRKEEFKDTALYWLRKTLNMSIFEDGLAGYKAHMAIEDDYMDSIGLLDGIVGIGLVLMATVSTVEPRWDRAFLLS